MNYYSFTDPEGLEGLVGLVGWLIADTLLTIKPVIPLNPFVLPPPQKKNNGE